ncbi:2-amino-4-hydroxy-6-hydroxymethyldihydropteridine diphosphokinase [Anaerospora hongkongensis]|uniref:2-amino-4-hydroxy-6-hydroxymethyldihydropteridine diphosphokinase n=1 Tax=Anaerospora hongkongensis TaxID=244830 RepID=A0A4R1Q0J5_9FIRM|nr:2-amino-4-hydroxy-6-hydroxymethyldihydropteridine diphosphokinase [Anaerospora hongkongensis]TCL38242.1 2-amino-4-hydroxy-6-hydroxymethyldihydropteridine diphosphokinase [Anaerospora hongkongensis]
MINCYIGLGSNMGDREWYLRQAVARLAELDGICISQVSSIYVTEPVGYTEQPAFLNAVAAVRTTLTAEQLLAACMKVEQSLARKRDLRWGPRTIDLDILLYGDRHICTQDLTVPHPRLMERLFVLIPLLEIAPDVALNGKSLEQCRQEMGDDRAVRLYRPWHKQQGE